MNQDLALRVLSEIMQWDMDRARMATYRASDSVQERHEGIRRAKGPNQWFQTVEFSFGTILPKDLPIDEQRYSDFIVTSK